ncbi:unnamed protein product [Brachionus calyciflorus]|uniref:Uncharacterized protein n=1 Tax=Brachionus calyciflorus TaxID=104777 RepID=A0A814PFQ7_9BILA|nr:unnamed protein product [Brachionus calyciflorus]
MNKPNTSAMDDDFEFRGETVFRFEGRNLLNYMNPIKLQEEIDAHINISEPMIDRAFINSKNKELYIITSDLKTIIHLEQHTWSSEAFGSGINVFKPKEKAYFIAVRGVPTSIDINDEKTIEKIKINNETCANHMLAHGLQIGYVNYKTELCRYQPRPK